MSKPDFRGDRLHLEPGEADTFSTVPPTVKEPWRVGVCHYREDLRNRLKTRLQKSRVGDFVPFAWSGIRNDYAWSEWIEE